MCTHLAEPDPRRRGAERCHQGPRLVRGFVGGRRDGVKWSKTHTRLPRSVIGNGRNGEHRVPLIGRRDADEVQSPALRAEHEIFRRSGRDGIGAGWYEHEWLPYGYGSPSVGVWLGMTA
jgi:hypothetical protein